MAAVDSTVKEASAVSHFAGADVNVLGVMKFFENSDSFDESFDHWVGAKDVNKFYFGMTLGADSSTVIKYENHMNKENRQCD